MAHDEEGRIPALDDGHAHLRVDVVEHLLEVAHGPARPVVAPVTALVEAQDAEAGRHQGGRQLVIASVMVAAAVHDEHEPARVVGRVEAAVQMAAFHGGFYKLVLHGFP